MDQRTDWLQVAVLFLTGLFAAFQFAKVSLTLGLHGEVYGLKEVGVSPLVSSVALVGLILGVIAGAVVARVGAKRAIVLACVLGGLLSIFQAALPGFGVMVGLRILEGFCHLAIVVAAPVLMSASASDRDRPIAMSIWAMFFGVAFSVAAAVFPLVLAQGGLPLLYVGHGVGLIACAGGLWARVPASPKTAAGGRPAPVALHRQIYSSARESLPGFSFFPYTFTFIALLAFLPERLPMAGLGELLPILTLVGTFGAGWAARYVSPETLGQWGYALTGAGAVLVWIGMDWAVYPMFLAMGIMPGASFAAIPHFNPSLEGRARAAGAIAQMGNLGTSTGTPVFGLVALSYGLGGLMTLTVVVCGLGFVLIHLSRQRIVRSG